MSPLYTRPAAPEAIPDWLTRSASMYLADFRSGSYFGPGNPSQIYDPLMMTTDKLYLTPVVVAKSVTVDRISFTVATAVAASTARLGVYASGSNGEPNTLQFDAGSISAATTGSKEITINQTLPAGVWWLALWASTVFYVPRVASIRNAVAPVNVLTYSLSSTVALIGSYASALPVTVSYTGTSSVGPFVSLRVA